MEDTRRTSRRWRIGSVVGLGGLLGFVALGVLVVVGMFMRSKGLVELFPWALGFFAVAIVGMLVAWTVKAPEDPEEKAALEQAAADAGAEAQAS